MKVRELSDGSIITEDFPIAGVVVTSALVLVALAVLGATLMHPITNKTGLGVALTMLIVGTGGLVTIFQSTVFTFDKTNQQVRWVVRTLFRREAGSMAFNDIQKIWLEWNRDRESGEPASAYVVLTTKTGEIRLTNRFLDESVCQLITVNIGRLLPKQSQFILESNQGKP
jgi:hypothetical protein